MSDSEELDILKPLPILGFGLGITLSVTIGEGGAVGEKQNVDEIQKCIRVQKALV